MTKWQYINVKVPYDVALLNGKGSASDVVKVVLGKEHEIVFDGDYPTTGSSPYGPYDEGDILFNKDGEVHMLSYDYMEVDDDVARIFRYCVCKED